jgi:hypothetical protein
LVSCGVNNPTIPNSEEEVELEDVILVQVNDPEGNILVLAGKDNGESVMALGEKDENGMTEKITGVFYTTGDEEGFLIELRNDGLPLSLVDSNGTEIIYSNYTDSTVEISIYDNKGNLIAGPTVVEIDPQKIKEIKELFQLYKTGARGWSETAEIFKAMGLIVGTATAAAVFMVGVVPATVVAAGVSFLLIVISTITSNDVDDAVSIGWGVATCANPLSCLGVASSIIGEAIELYNNNDPEIYNHPPVIFELSANPPNVDISQTTTINCSAYDPDGDSLAYRWTKNGGAFIGSTSGSSVTWRAPSTPGIYRVYCEVTDGEGGEDNDSANIIVAESDEDKIRSVCNKLVSALNNKNWSRARSYCINGSEAYNQIYQLENDVNNSESLYGPGNLNINANINNVVINGNYATVYGYFNYIFTAGSYIEENSGSVTGYLEKIDNNWKIYRGVI